MLEEEKSLPRSDSGGKGMWNAVDLKLILKVVMPSLHEDCDVIRRLLLSIQAMVRIDNFTLACWKPSVDWR